MILIMNNYDNLAIKNDVDRFSTTKKRRHSYIKLHNHICCLILITFLHLIHSFNQAFLFIH